MSMSSSDVSSSSSLVSSNPEHISSSSSMSRSDQHPVTTIVSSTLSASSSSTSQSQPLTGRTNAGDLSLDGEATTKVKRLLEPLSDLEEETMDERVKEVYSLDGRHIQLAAELLVDDPGCEVDPHTMIVFMYRARDLKELEIAKLFCEKGIAVCHSFGMQYLIPELLLYLVSIDIGRKDYAGAEKALDKLYQIVPSAINEEIIVTVPEGETRSPLFHYYARMGNLEAVNLLLRYGASPDSLDEEENTPVEVARTYGHIEIAERIALVRLRKVRQQKELNKHPVPVLAKVQEHKDRS